MGLIKVNPATASWKCNPASANAKLYAGGTNACLKYINRGGPTPTQITDSSGRGNHGAFTDAPTPALVGDLWTYQFVSADTNYCLVPDIAELLGATAATWCAWVRKDAYVANQCIASDYKTSGDERKWAFGLESSENLWSGIVSVNGDTRATASLASAFTTGWHFVWMRFTGNSATGLEAGCDSATATPVSTTAVASIWNASHNHTFIGNYNNGGAYSSITLGALAIWPRAITDAERDYWRYHTKSLLGL